MDSLDGVEFSMRIEEAFKIKIDEEEFELLKSIDDIESFLTNNRARMSGPERTVQ
jgi:acyl carrier protein